jgi:hypothetical protein
MLNVWALMRHKFLILIVFLSLLCPSPVHKATASAYIDYEVPVNNLTISETTHLDVWKLCEKNDFSYELFLAVLHIEGVNDPKTVSIEAEIENLVNIRNYWSQQGFPDEIVFDLMLLSREIGIEGCEIFIKDSDSNKLKSDYVQKVTEYKYYLEQTQIII